MFDSSINNQNLSVYSVISTSLHNDGAYGLSSAVLNPFNNLHNTSSIFSVENELIHGITDYSPQQKIISADYLIREKFSNLLTNPNIHDLLGIAYGVNCQIDLATFLLQSQINNGFQNVQISVIDSGILGNANGAYADSLNTIFLAHEFVKTNSIEVIAQVLTEEFGHFIDAQIKETDSAGDEGRIFAKLVFNQPFMPEELNSLKAEDDYGVIYYNNQFINIEKSELEIINDIGETLVINEDTTLVFQWTQREAKYNNEVGIIVFDNPEGKIDGISPQQAGYLQKLLTSGRSEVIFAKGSSAGNWKQVDFKAGDYVGFYLIQNASTSEYLNQPNSINIFSSITAANTDNFDHIFSTNLGTGVYRFSWEDLTGGGDKDFNDVVFNVFKKGFNAGGNDTQLVPLTVELNSKEASYQNEIGFYLVDDIHGNINGISPNDANYAKEVFKQNNYQVIFGEGNYSGVKEYTVTGEQYIGWYLISNNTSERFLQTNPNNNPDGGVVAYFSYAEANPDKLNHLIHYSSNQMGWEDVLGLGDKDYNDLVFNFNFGNPRDIGLTVDNVSLTELDDENNVAEFKVRLSEPHLNPVTINYTTEDDTAISGEDYQTVAGSLTFLPDEIEKTITVQVFGDDNEELDEVFNLKLTNVINAVIVDGEATATIINDEEAINPVLNNSPVADADKTISVEENSQPVELNINPPTDVDGDTLTITINQLPDNTKGIVTKNDGIQVNVNDSLTITELTNLIFTPVADANGNVGSFVYTVSDGKGGNDSQRITFNITSNNIVSLSNINSAPEFVSEPESEIIVGKNYSYDANAVDEDNDTLFYSLLIAPEGLTIDNKTGILNWENVTAGNYNISLLVEDGKGGQDRQDYSLSVIAPSGNRPPVFVSTPVVYANINTEYRYEALATDADNDNLTYAVINAPEGLVINQNTGVITWTPTTLGEVEITLQVSDGKAGIATQKYKILVQEQETDNYAPVIISEAIVKASTSQNYVYDVNAIDPDADNLTYSLVTAPQGMTINASTGEIIWNTATQTIGNYDVTVRVIDNRGGVDTQEFVIALNNTPLGSITGFKWEDANGNGFRDTALVQGDNPDVVFVLDVSGSADDPFAGSSIGDLNNDGRNNTRLDAEIAGFIALNQQLITQGLGTRANVAIIVFSGRAANADMDLVTSGVQLTATPTTDVNSNGVADVEEILRSIRSGAFGVGNFTGTNIEAALQKVEQTFTAIGTDTGNGNLVFLTDGESNRGGSITDEVERLKAKGFNLSAFGVGEDASLTQIKTIDPDAIKFTSTDELLGVFGSLEGEESFIESGLAGVTVYLDLNNNGILDANEPIQITASDNPNTPNIDETGQYKFTGLEAGTYIVREVVPTDYEQTYPLGNSGNQGDGYADVILEFVSGGKAPSPLIEPYGSTGGLPSRSPFNGNGRYTVEPVNPNVILGAPPPSPIIGSNPQVDWLALPTGSSVTVGFTDERIIDGPGDDIFIRSFDPQDSANEFADVYVSSNGTDFELLGRVNERGLVSLNLATIGFTEPVVAVRVVGVDNRGTSPGFDLIGVEVLPGSKVSPDFYTVQLKARETVNNINFGNKKIDQPIPNEAPVFTSTAPTTAQIGELLTYQATATDANNDVLTYSLLVQPEGMAVDSQTGILIWQPKQNQVGNNRVVLRVSDGKGGLTIQEFILNTRAINTPPQIISSPNTIALLNNTYTYEVRATDPNNDTLTYSLINAIQGMTINANTGLIEYTPTQLGTQTVEIQVTDGFGGTNVQSYQLQVLENLPNRLPTITSTPQILIRSGSLYQYDVNATDPEKTTITYGLTNKPNGMTIDANTGLISWQTQANVNGDFQVTVSATDADGGTAYQNYYVKVFPNQNPVITSTPVELAQIGFTYEYDVIAGDVDGDFLNYTLTEAPTGLTIDPFGRLRWQPKTQDEGIYPITIKVDDGRGGIVTQNYNLTVTDDDIVKPVVEIGFSSKVIKIGETVNLQIRGTDNIGVTTLNLTVDGTPLTLNPNIANDQINNATFVGQNAGLYQFLGTAIDEAGNIGTATIEVRVVDPSDTSAPIIEINTTNLQATQGIIKAPTDIIATVTDNNLEFYRVEFAPVDAINLDNISENDADYVLLSEGNSNITNQTVANLDPRLLANGSYLVKITAFDFSGNGNIQAVILNVAGQNKPGDFSLEYTDLSIPLTGIPIEITRRYNSLESSTLGDFGYGWDLGLQDANIVEASPDGRDLSDDARDLFGTLTTFSVGTRVTLNTPDGRRVGFTFNPVPVSASFFGTTYAPSFTPDAGVFDKLEVENAPLTIRSDGKVGLFFFSFVGYNPSKYKLTTRDGTVYNYDQNFGLIDIKDRNGNILTFSDEGIVSSTGAEIEFKRDTQGRITEIIDPDGKSIKYSYDSKGDLVAVSDRTNNTTQLVYNEPNRQHFLTEIIDPLGRKATRTEYDENGQISKIIDANGNELEINFDAAASSQTIKDPFGNTITRIFDNQGNVIQEVDQLGGITLRTYDANNNLLSLKDPLGNTATYTYDSRGNLLTQTNALNQTTTYTYNDLNKVITVTDPLGNTTQNTYDSQGNLVSQRNAAGNITTYVYDARGNVTTVTSPQNQTTKYEYDSQGRITGIIDALNQKTGMTYDGNGNLLSITTPLGNTTRFTYDAEGRPISITDALGNVSRIEYNALGDRTATIDALGRRREFSYDTQGQLIENRYSDGTTERFTYDANGRRTSYTDRGGRTTIFVYDALGRLIETITPDGTPDNLADNPRTRNEYDAAGRLIGFIDERGNRTEYGYDAADRQILVRDALNNPTRYAYNAAGELITITDALNRATQFVYDPLGRVVENRYPDGTKTITTYDALGRVIAETDQAGITTQFEYDALDRLTAVVDALGQRTEYGYDADGNLLSQKDAKGNTTTYQYDVVNQRLATILPLGQRSTSTYDAVGNITSVTDFNGKTITYTYNSNDQIIAEGFANGTSVTYTYTPTLQRATVTDARGVTRYTYDERDQLTARTEVDGRTISYTYDLAGNRTSVTTPAGTVGYSYDALNRMQTVTDRSAGLTKYIYDAVGNLVRTELPNNTVETRQYDSLDRLIAVEQRGSSGVIAGFEYTLGTAGNRLAVKEANGREVNYTYDQLYRLVSEAISDGTAGNRTISYTYDAVGNRLTRNDSVEGVTTYTYDNNDRLLREILNGTVTEYTYDESGSTLSVKVNGTDTVNYRWDDKGRLIAVDIITAQGTERIEYRYDADGNRVTVIVNGQETRYLIDTEEAYAQVVEEYTPDGTILKSYVYGLDLISQDQQGEQSFHHAAGLGSVNAVTDSNGNVTDRYVYDAFGRLIGQQGNTDNEFRFTGEQFDENSDLYYLRARYYDPENGRFISRDSFEGFQDDPLSLHKYTYVHNNPVNLTDPSGNVTLAQGGLVATISLSLARVLAGVPRLAALARATVASVQNLSQLQSVVESAFLSGGIIFGVLVGLEAVSIALQNLPNEPSPPKPDTGDGSGNAGNSGAGNSAKGGTSSTGAPSPLGDDNEPTQKEKSKDRRLRQQRETKEQKYGDSDYEESASEGYVKFRARELQNEQGKDARRRAHDAKIPGSGDRTRSQIDNDYQ